MPMKPPNGRKVKSGSADITEATDRHERASPSKHAVKSSIMPLVCCGYGKDSALPAPGRCGSRTGCCRSVSDFRRYIKRKTGVGTVHRAAYARVCDKPLKSAGCLANVG